MMDNCKMNWHWQYPGETQLWPQIGIVQEFMSGIKLDEENWQVGEPQVTPDKAVEMYYLRNFVAGSYRACRVISNRTYNFYTQSVDLPCHDENLLEFQTNQIYLISEDHISSNYDDILLLPEMGFLKHYTIEWVNALTNVEIFSENQFTNLSSELVMQFPTLTGGEQQPIIFFRVYPFDEASFKSEVKDTTINKTIVDLSVNPYDSLHYPAITDWSNTSLINTDFLFTVTPNPTSGEIIVKNNLKEFDEVTWTITSENGVLIKSGYINGNTLNFNLEDFSDGIYYLIIEKENQKYVQKIIKQ